MNKQEAAEYLNISVRTLQRLTADGAIIAGMVKGKTGLVTDYTKDDLDAYKKRAAEPQQRDDTRYVKPHVIPSDAPSQALQRVGSVEGVKAFALMIADALRGAQTPADGHRAEPSITELNAKFLLTLKDAARLSSLSTGHLANALTTGQLKGKKIGKGWKIAPDALKTYVGKVLK
jgi:excisionase family DNA binding protein